MANGNAHRLAPYFNSDNRVEGRGPERPVEPDEHGYGSRPKSQKDSGMSKMRKKMKELQEECMQAQNEMRHYKDRVVRAEESHRLELQRMRKEVDYHKRLRLGADQRAFELEDRLRLQQRQTSSFDEAQSSLIEQSQLLLSKNAELAYKVKTLEAQVAQQQELQGCLEAQLNDVLQDRDRLEGELQQVLEQRQQSGNLGALTLAEGDAEEEDENDDAGEEG